MTTVDQLVPHGRSRVLANSRAASVLTVRQLRISLDRLRDDLTLLLPRQMTTMQIQRERQAAQLLLGLIGDGARAVQIVLAGDLVAVVTVDDGAVRCDEDRDLDTVLTDRLL